MQEVLSSSNGEGTHGRVDVASRKKALEVAKKERRYASAVAHEQAVALIKVSRWFRSYSSAVMIWQPALLPFLKKNARYCEHLVDSGGGKEGRHDVLVCLVLRGELCVLKRNTWRSGLNMMAMKREQQPQLWEVSLSNTTLQAIWHY